jgi:mismatch-specific thymine-DNA glycosylase
MKTLTDLLPKGSRLIIVGCNPSPVSARIGCYYAGRGNQFWSLLHESGLVPERLRPLDTVRVTEFGIGLTDLVKRPSKSSSDVSTREFAAGRKALHRKLRRIVPSVIVFNGKVVYEQFTGTRCEYGLQKERIYGATVYVLPSTSTRCARTSYKQKLRHFRGVFKLSESLSQFKKTPGTPKTQIETIRKVK